MVPSFHRDLVRGVATYALELFRGAPPLDTVYVPIGLGSGICGVITMRDALSPDQRIASNRYFDGSPINPAHFARNWNRTRPFGVDANGVTPR
jgi:hypothetical protein